MNHSSRGKKRSAGDTPSPYVRATGMVRDCWALGLLSFQEGSCPSLRMRRFTLDPAQLAAGRARHDRERPAPISTPARSSCATATARPSRTTPTPRRPVARSRRCAAGPGSSRRVRASSRARPTSTTPAWPRPPGTPGGWQAVEWDLVGPFGIDAPGAWTQLAAMGARGGAGVKVAVVDTGVAYANRPPYRRSPDLPAKRMRPGYDFVDNDRLPQRPQRARHVRRQRDRRGRRQPLRHDRRRLRGGHHARARPRLPRRGRPRRPSRAASATPSTTARR